MLNVYKKVYPKHPNGENLNDFFTTTSTTSTTTLPPVIISSKNNPYGVNWGIWGTSEECAGDDTSINGVELICSNGKRIKSSEGDFGYWDTVYRNCSNGQKINGLYGIENTVEPRYNEPLYYETSI
ncbi:unnamed protein product [Brachionus calyciflorus]|uniref:Uncharacterized protein n=1 Tax=Brachionus calyciflorus TaxID=104777 RepID=A0A814MXJ9_9BILA|nr:unnamed protein product [Brachionus calyciflorus]